MSVTGSPEGEPQKVGVALVDILTGLNATIGILAALEQRHRTGRGQHIDIALFDVAVASLANQALNFLVGGSAPHRLGNAHPNIVPYQAFETSDGHLILAVGNDAQFARFCRLAEMPELADDARYATNRERVAHRETLVPLIAAALKRQATGAWLAMPLSALARHPDTDVDDYITLGFSPFSQNQINEGVERLRKVLMELTSVSAPPSGL